MSNENNVTVLTEDPVAALAAKLVALPADGILSIEACPKSIITMALTHAYHTLGRDIDAVVRLDDADFPYEILITSNEPVPTGPPQIFASAYTETSGLLTALFQSYPIRIEVLPPDGGIGYIVRVMRLDNEMRPIVEDHVLGETLDEITAKKTTDHFVVFIDMLTEALTDIQRRMSIPKPPEPTDPT